MSLRTLLVLLCAVALAGCSAGGGGSGQPLPTVVLGNDTPAGITTSQPAAPSYDGGVTASGQVIPAQDAQLAFALAGSVAKVAVSLGDEVQAGDVLAELDNSALQIQVDEAQRVVRELTSAAAIAAAEQAVVTAQDAAEDAQNKSDSYKVHRASQEQIENAEANLVLAQDALDEAYRAYQKFKNNPPDDPRRAQAYTNYYAAVKARDNAQSSLNWLTGGPSEEDIALADANLHAAAAALQEARWYLSDLKGEAIPVDATGAQLAQLQQARDNLEAAQDQLARTRLLSPISGTVSSVDTAVGEYIIPGQAVISVTDMVNLEVETSDLSELDVPEVTVGQKVNVQVKALQTEIPGRVISISPVASTLGGDVVYSTTVGLDSLPEGLRPGMSVTVEYLP